MKCELRFVVLFIIGLLSGCGSTSPPADEAVKDFIADSLGKTLVVKSLYAQHKLGHLQGMPPPFELPPATIPPPETLLEGMSVGSTNARPFSVISKRPKVQANRDNSEIGATVAEVIITAEKSEPEKITYAFTVTQVLTENLYRLQSASHLQEAIGWKKDDLSKTLSAARRLSTSEIQQLDEQFQQARDGREYLLELAHTQGTPWKAEGEVVASLNQGKWQFEIKRIKPENRPDLHVLTAASAPRGLMTVDPANYQASAIEWSKPYQDFIANVDRIVAAKATQITQREKLLNEFTLPGQSWSAFVKTPQSGFDITIQIREVSDQAVRRGNFIVTVAEKRLEFPIFGLNTSFYEAEARELGFAIDGELLGPVLLIQPLMPDELRTPFNELKCRITVRPGDQGPTFLWLGQIIPMAKAPGSI